MEKNIAERLKVLRNSEGKTQAEFAKLLDTTGLRTYLRYESGERNPDFDFLYAIKMKLNIDLNWLVCGEGKRPISISASSMAERILSLEERVKALEDNAQNGAN